MLRSPERSGWSMADGRNRSGIKSEVRRQLMYLLSKRMVVDRVAQLHRVFDLPLHQLDTFQRHLAATRSNDARIW